MSYDPIYDASLLDSEICSGPQHGVDRTPPSGKLCKSMTTPTWAMEVAARGCRCSIGDSGDEGIGQGQTAWGGISQTDRGEAGFRVHGQEGGQTDRVLQEDVLPNFHLRHQFAQSGVEFDPGWSRQGYGAWAPGKQGFHFVRAGFIQEMGENRANGSLEMGGADGFVSGSLRK